MAAVRSVLDSFYLIFFVSHTFLILLNDCTLFYPAWIHDSPLSKLFMTDFYNDLSQDPFFKEMPLFFRFFLSLELVFQTPACIYLAWAIYKGRQGLRWLVTLIVFGVLIAVTSQACIAETKGWQGKDAEKRGLIVGMYGGYAALGVVMAVDGWLRLGNFEERKIKAP